MTEIVVAIFTVLVPFIIWLWQRGAAKNDDPVQKAVKWREDAHKEIINDDEDSANSRLADALFRWRVRKHSTNRRRPTHPPDQSR